ASRIDHAKPIGWNFQRHARLRSEKLRSRQAPASVNYAAEVTEAKTSADSRLRKFHSTQLGKIYRGDSLKLFRERIEDHSVDLIMTSPPFGLVRKKLRECRRAQLRRVVQTVWRGVSKSSKASWIARHRYRRRLDVGPADAKSLPLRALDFALS